MAKIPEEQLPQLVSQLKASNPGRMLRLLSTEVDEEEFEVIALVPSREAYIKAQDLATDPDHVTRNRAAEELVRECVVHPPAVDLDRLLEVRAGLGTSLGNKLTELAGGAAEVKAKKL